ncbi:bile acid:sodium symporter family protein [Marinilactibacillus psychrotolerans]|uniref:Bile acid:sodium symporter family protein n=2 Tax=Marinilactibacillus psychrotolerans TaxID=191770 RepID=A0ABW8UK86_9LACT|nr:bile acid:sodium symporter family protein [Marinilactibacillus psychrotolerans]GEQ33217.1 sodium transporter [Marinilactibacillus psychrotolerans]SJN45632.1 Sodium-dependent transporter [Marinilactibacillus psychrotolerans 42ea]
MHYLKRLNELFTQYLSWIVILTAAAALLVPNVFTWAAGITTYTLQFIMFTMGMTMKPSDFSEVMKKPWQVFLVVFGQYLFMPLSALALSSLFNLSSEIALGLLLVGSVPGGTSSNVMAYLANGNLPLSISATSVSTLLSPILTPVMLSLYGGAYLNIDFWTMFFSIIQVVLLPVLLGLTVSYFFGKQTEKAEKILPSFSSLAVLLVLAGTVSVNQENLLSTGLIIFLVVWLHNLSGYGISYLACKVLKRDIPTTRTVAVEVGLQNTGLAANLGLAHFTPATALAAAAGTIVHTLFGTIYANLCRRKDKKKLELINSITPVSNNIKA